MKSHKNEPVYKYNKKVGLTVVYHRINHRLICGSAWVAPEDKKYANAYTGYRIAEARMMIDYAKQHIKYDLQPKLEAFNHLLSTMKQSSHFNPKSYEAKRIFQERQNIIDDIEEMKAYIAATKAATDEFIQQKDIIYRQFEKNQAKESQEAQEAENN